jgi:hypothetical protein
MTKRDTDFHQWAFEQAQRLRSGEPVNVENIAEELETLGRSEERELTNRFAVLLQHLLKCGRQSGKRAASWGATIKEQRRRIARLLDQNPSLGPKLPECVRDAYATAVTFASVETGIIEDDFPAECPYAIEELLS